MAHSEEKNQPEVFLKDTMAYILDKLQDSHFKDTQRTKGRCGES